jgi:phosphohistidine phosphatase
LLENLLYLASAPDIIAVLRTVKQDAASVMIVGHNPGLEQLVAGLAGEEHDLPTAALAHVLLPVDRWGDLDMSTRGTLLGLWRPKELT